MAQPSQKISEIVAEYQTEGKPFVSIEFFPPKTEAGLTSLSSVIAKLKTKSPIFADYTWGAGGSTSDLTVQLCLDAKEKHGLNPNMHLTCTNMDLAKVDTALAQCKEAGITNILALRGDPPAGQDKWEATEGGLTCALDLVRYIKKHHDEYFSISVAGYPEGHPEAMSKVDSMDELTPSEKERCNVIKNDETGEVTINVCKDAQYQTELEYLKAKCDAGASFIVTQMVFDADVYRHFVLACRNIGITVPIVPGIMCINGYGGFKRMTSFCKSRVPEDTMRRLEAVKDDDKACKALGITLGAELCNTLLAYNTPGLHFYTLNLANTTMAIIDQVFPDRATAAAAAPVTVFTAATEQQQQLASN